MTSDVGLFLRQARIDKSLTGYQLAKILKISQQQVSRYERGKQVLMLKY
ncbi:helix-turn-helix transcriptional regulator [Providencia rettgeri]|nr:helix-turn-helix transcriptional regulator [Providencia rettgeri]